MSVKIEGYCDTDEQQWLDLHARVMVDSYAWWSVIHKKPVYKYRTIDLVAKINGQLVGFITVEMGNYPEAGFVWEFGVDRDFRGRDIGRQLIDAAHFMMCSDFSINKSYWYSQDENAQRYYQHLGMTEIERHWEFKIAPDEALYNQLLEQGFNCGSLHGTCEIDQLETIRQKFDVIEDSDESKPRMCIGYEYVKQ